MTNYTTTNDSPTLTVCVGNYGFYNEGELRDSWVNLPMEPSEIMPWLRARELYDERHEETYISDVDDWPFESFKPDLMNIHDANRLALAMQHAGSDGVETVAAALECTCDTPDSVDGLINLLLQADEIPYAELPLDHWGQPSLEAYGLELAEDTGLYQMLEESGADCYFDFEAYGRDALTDYLTSDSGYLYDDMPDEDLYSSDEIDEVLGLEKQDKAA